MFIKQVLDQFELPFRSADNFGLLIFGKLALAHSIILFCNRQRIHPHVLAVPQFSNCTVIPPTFPKALYLVYLYLASCMMVYD